MKDESVEISYCIDLKLVYDVGENKLAINTIYEALECINNDSKNINPNLEFIKIA